MQYFTKLKLMGKIHNEQLINIINKEKICDRAVLSHIEP